MATIHMAWNVCAFLSPPKMIWHNIGVVNWKHKLNKLKIGVRSLECYE